MTDTGVRIGIDLGGTKVAGVLLDAAGGELRRIRRPTPPDYAATLATVRELLAELERDLSSSATVGVGMPGTLVPRTGLIKNANRSWLNDRPFRNDLERVLGRPVRCANDADCFAASEAADGAGEGARVVLAVILGTGCGAGLAIDGRPWPGANGVAGEWGHNPLPWPEPDEEPGPECYCGRRGCIEMWISGPGLAADHQRAGGPGALTARDVAERAAAGNNAAEATLARHRQRLARSLAAVVNVIDPDVIVLGGGLSNLRGLYDGLTEAIAPFVFGGEFRTPVLPARHGDASGVRGAARLWDSARDSEDELFQRPPATA